MGVLLESPSPPRDGKAVALGMGVGTGRLVDDTQWRGRIGQKSNGESDEEGR